MTLPVALSSSHSEDEWLVLERELTELREHHQRTLKDYARMEQRLENLQSELEMIRNQGKTYSSGSEYSQSSGFHTTNNSNVCLEDMTRSLPDLHFGLQSSTPICTANDENQTSSIINDLRIQVKSLERQNMNLLEENNQLKQENKKILVGRTEDMTREIYEREIETLKESNTQLLEELQTLKQSDPAVHVR